ncbi:MAG: zf-HC2 domain-containing protein [Planctomycetes bacterium]|nr:zf-HC2 domain-containing protein [Planctomycetota bacterium]
MRCEEFESLWNERLDNRGPLDFDQEAALEEHRQACPRCRELAMALGVGLDVLHALPAEASKIDLADRVVAQLEPRRPRVRRQLVFAGACLAAAASVALVVWNSATKPVAPGQGKKVEVVAVEPAARLTRPSAGPAADGPTGLAAVWNLMPEFSSHAAAASDMNAATTTAELEDEVINSLSPVTNSATSALGTLRRLLPSATEEPSS